MLKASLAVCLSAFEFCSCWFFVSSDLTIFLLTRQTILISRSMCFFWKDNFDSVLRFDILGSCLKELCAKNYAARFSVLLHLEEIQQEIDIREYDMERVKLKFVVQSFLLLWLVWMETKIIYFLIKF